MPGLVGLVTRLPRKQAEATLERMLAVMRHEPFYISSTHVDESLGVFAGWTALEGSFGAAAPLTNGSGDVSMVFCGEEYSASGTSGSSVAQVYEDDESFPEPLNGIFHGLVIDRPRRRVWLFNDRYGMHRLYWHQTEDAVYFAAEAKAILAVCPELRRLSPQGLGEAISLGCVLEDRTLFEGLAVMPGASRWTFENRSLARRDTYFTPDRWEEQPAQDARTFYETVRETFRRVLPSYFAGGQQVGMSLTGGLDTRMVMAWQDRSPGTLPCYSFGGPFRESRDVTVAREVARTCNQPCTSIQIGDEFLKRFAHYASRAVMLTDGGADPRHAADVYLNEQARRIAPVRMTGLFGGEVLRRVRAFVPTVMTRDLFPGVSPEIAEARQAYARTLQGHAVSFAAFRQAPWHHQTSLSLERSLVTVRSPFLDTAFVKALYRAPDAALRSDALSMRLIADGNPKLAGIPTDRGRSGSSTLMGAVAALYHESMFKAEYAFDYGMPQWLAGAGRVLAPLGLDRFFLGRHKLTHFRRWYQGPLAPYVRDVLLDPRSLARPYLNRKAVERIVRSHTMGAGNYTSEIHRLLRLELTCRQFVDGNVT